MIDQKLITKDPEIMSGTPVFAGTRVPIKNLIDYLQGGHTLDDFLEAFPTVEREQAIEVLGLARELLVSQAG
ncbi:MAG TPA: DUF433 domain-containing protein [Chloroflexia bacterium]|nr:DUF433 domain-containing protein [Chloroflexia bacterium]